MNKNYCNRCRRLDTELPVLINIHTGIISYGNIRESQEKGFEESEKKMFIALASFPKDASLCHECFINFFDYLKGSTDKSKKLKIQA